MPADVIAHRGASAYADEHTFAAYDLALAQGADVLEIDLRVTADGEIIVVHDATLARIAGDPRRVDEVTRPALDDLGPRRPPSLAMVLDRYGVTTRYLLELKEPCPAWEPDVVAAVRARGLDDRVVLQSFDASALRRLHADAPDIPVVLLVDSPSRDPERAADAAPWLQAQKSPGSDRSQRGNASLDFALDTAGAFASGIGIWHAELTQALARRANDRGLTVAAWTANAPQEIDRAIACGADGIITDVPDVARTLVDRASTAISALAA